MAIAIRPIPVLTGDSAERFEQMVETGKSTAYTSIPEGYIASIRKMLARSEQAVIKMPKH